jgi:hypothetical protein
VLEDWNTSCELKLTHNGVPNATGSKMEIKLLILSVLIGIIAVFSHSATTVAEPDQRSASAQ